MALLQFLRIVASWAPTGSAAEMLVKENGVASDTHSVGLCCSRIRIAGGDLGGVLEGEGCYCIAPVLQLRAALVRSL